MRQIKFRGKNSNDEWVYGSLIINETENEKGKFQVAFIVPGLPCASEGGDFYTARMERVKIETIGQYTGLLDKNGKKIYEGDILDVTVFDCFDNDKQYRVLVEWVGTEFMGVDVTDDSAAWNLCWLCNQDEEIEVIGNIYDNHELINK